MEDKLESVAKFAIENLESKLPDGGYRDSISEATRSIIHEKISSINTDIKEKTNVFYVVKNTFDFLKSLSTGEYDNFDNVQDSDKMARQKAGQMALSDAASIILNESRDKLYEFLPKEKFEEAAKQYVPENADKRLGAVVDIGIKSLSEKLEQQVYKDSLPAEMQSTITENLREIESGFSNGKNSYKAANNLFKFIKQVKSGKYDISPDTKDVDEKNRMKAGIEGFKYEMGALSKSFKSGIEKIVATDSLVKLSATYEKPLSVFERVSKFINRVFDTKKHRREAIAKGDGFSSLYPLAGSPGVNNGGQVVPKEDQTTIDASSSSITTTKTKTHKTAEEMKNSLSNNSRSNPKIKVSFKPKLAGKSSSRSL
jgi:hypothetical protein